VPGGSQSDPNLFPIDVAVDELREETGISLHPGRLRKVFARQAVATVSVHQTTLFAAEITLDELNILRSKAGKQFGVGGEERTTIEVWTVTDLLRSVDLDWTTLGMVCAALDASGF